jgi:PAP2 superfamily
METTAMPRSGVQRGWRGGVADWFPIAMVLVAYLVLHELSTTLIPVAHVQPQLGFDEFVFGGTAPTVRLQRALWNPGDPHWYDYAVWLVYLSHFVVTLTVAIVLWFRDYPGFRRYRVLIVTVTFAGFITYIVYPAIPPWLAATRGDMPRAVRVVKEIWTHMGLASVARVFGEQSRYAFPVGALPSLHAAWPFMLMLFFWSRAGRWRILLVAYTLAMALTLVYSADHFVFDILMGWTYATVVFVVARAIWRRRGWRYAAAAP